MSPPFEIGDVVVDRKTLRTRSVRFTYAMTGSGPAVMLVPGSGGWELTFHRMISLLAESHTVYAVDPPGQGGSRVIDPNFAADADGVATSLAEFAGAAGLASVTVVGHSWGGGFALRLAESHPKLVERLALLAPAGAAVKDVWEFRALRMRFVGDVAARLTSTKTVRHMMRKSFSNPALMPAPALMRAAAREMRTSPSLRHDMLAIERGVRWNDTERELASVECPVLILWAANDRYLPPETLDRLRAGLPNAVTHVISQAGHAVHDDSPDAVYPKLMEFLGSSVRPETR